MPQVKVLTLKAGTKLLKGVGKGNISLENKFYQSKLTKQLT